MSRLISEANPNANMTESDGALQSPPWFRDRIADYDNKNYNEAWSAARLYGAQGGGGIPLSNTVALFEPVEIGFGATHTINVLSDQIDVELGEVATNWAQIGTWTTSPAIVDDNRIQGNNCLQGRNSNVQGFSGIIMPPMDQVWQFDDSTGLYVDISNGFKSSTATDTTCFPATEAVADQMQMGWKIPFGGIIFTFGTVGTVGTLTWKYWNGSSWTAFSGVADGTTGLTAAGTVTWTVPTDWVRRSINGSAKLYYAVAEVTGLYTINPIVSQGIPVYSPGNNGHSIYFWINNACPASTDTFQRGGLRMSASSDLTPTLSGTWPNSGPTNSRQWWLSGSDGLRTSGFVPYVVNPSNAGSLNIGSVNTDRIRRVGLGIGMVSAIGASTTNIFWDAVRIGTGLILRNGTSDTANTFADILSADHNLGSMYGVITNTGGIYYISGKLYMGENDQPSPMVFKDINQAIVFRNVPVATAFNEIRVIGLAGQTSTFELGNYANSLASDGCTIRGAARTNVADPSPTKSVWTLTASDTYAVVNLYDSTFSDLYRASFNSSAVIRSCTFQKFGNITAGGALFDDCAFRNLDTAAPISATYAVDVNTIAPYLTNCVFVNCATAVKWNVATSTSGRLDSTSFTSGGTGHAIELGASCPATIGLAGVTFTSYGLDATTDAAIYNNSGAAIVINISGGGTVPTIRNGAGASTTINNLVTLTVTCKNAAGILIDSGIRIRIEKVSDGSLIAEGTTDGVGVYATTYNYTANLAVNIIARKKGYKFNQASDTILSTGLSVPFTMIRDEAVSLP